MNTQDNLNLAVEYLEVVTCTYKELCAIKTPTNGRLYHTSDTNEFYFDWNNRRHKLSVFSTQSSGANDYVKKSELGTWLAENDYITNLSLADELVNVIGSPIENIITKQALDNYASNYLLTKEELGLLNEPLNLIENINSLRDTDRNLYSYCERLAGQINEVRTVANSKISSGELNTKLNEYLKKSLAESLYVTKEDADALYIDEEEFLEKIQNYVTREQLTESLLPYQKTSDADSKYATKNEVNDKYLQKTAANRIYATKSEVSDTYETKEGVDAKLEDYLKKSDTDEFLTKDDVESTFVKKTELNKYETTNGVDGKLSEFAKKMWVEEYYTQKEDIRRELSNYATKEYVSGQLSDYATNESVDEKIEQTNRQITETNNKFQKYATKAQLQDVVSSIPTVNEFATKSELDTKVSGFITEDIVDGKLSNYATNDSVDEKVSQTNSEITNVKNRLNNYATKAQLQEVVSSIPSTSEFATKSELDTKVSDFVTDSDVERKLGDYTTKEYVDDKVSKTNNELTNVKNRLNNYATKAQLQEVIDSIPSQAEGYVTTEELNRRVSDFQTSDEVDAKLSGYATNGSVNEKVNRTNSEITNVKNRLNNYATKAQLQEAMSSIPSTSELVTKSEFNSRVSDFATNDDVDGKLGSYATKEYVDDKSNQTDRRLNSIDGRFGSYVTKSQLQTKLEGYVEKGSASSFVTMSDVVDKLSEYEKSDNVESRLDNYASKEYVDNKTSGINNEINNVKNRLNSFATKSQLQSSLDGYLTKNEAASTYSTTTDVNRKLQNYETTSSVDSKLSRYETTASVTEKLKDYLNKSQIADTYVQKSALNDYAKLSDLNDDLSTFAKSIWVDEYYMKKFKLSDYMKSDDIYDIFLKKSSAEDTYLSKNDAAKTYAKISDILGKDPDSFVRREEMDSFAKMMWVDEYYMRKGQITGIQNAMVLSNEFGTERELRAALGNVQQGFYYLTTDQALMVAVDTGAGDKMLVNLTNLEADFAMYFGGDEVNW